VNKEDANAVGQSSLHLGIAPRAKLTRLAARGANFIST